MSVSASLCAAAALPLPRFDPGALDTYLDLVGDPTPLIRRGLPIVPPVEWQNGADGLAELFGLNSANHCFHIPPHSWASFHEPQITCGFVHFLNSGDHRRRLARAIALVWAAAGCAGKEIETSALRWARCTAEENRTDILVELQGGPRPIGASIEAKFGHLLTQEQLPKAFDYVSDRRKWDVAKSVLLVVAPDPADLDADIMRRSHESGWRATSWWAFLGHLERLTDPTHDCDDYRRFRRTVWHRAY